MSHIAPLRTMPFSVSKLPINSLLNWTGQKSNGHHYFPSFVAYFVERGQPSKADVLCDYKSASSVVSSTSGDDPPPNKAVLDIPSSQVQKVTPT